MTDVDLRETNFQRIKDFVNEELSIDTLIQMIRDYQISDQDVKQMVEQLEEVDKVTKRHKQIIHFVRNQIFLELNIM